MRKNLLSVMILCFGFLLTATAQEAPEEKNTEPAGYKNQVKINLPALALKNITVQYERAVAKKVTVAGTFRVMPKGSIPLKSTFVNLADDPDTERQINNLSIGNVAFMPEVRYYFSKKGAFNGFYLGLYANIAKYNADVAIEYDNNGTTESIPMTGHVNGITGGLMIGTQFRLSKRLNLDWWILGPNYGSSKGTLTGMKNMDALEQQDLRNELADLDIPLTEFTYNVNSTGATINFKGPWAGLRAGLCLAFRF